MPKRGIVCLVAVFALLGADAAFANKVQHKGLAVGPVKDMGTVVGTVIIGKVIDECMNDGRGFVSGPGLGMPALSKNKNLWFSVRALADETPVGGRPTGVHSIYNNHVGDLRLCGKVGPVASKEGSQVRPPCLNPPGSKPAGDTSCDNDALRRQTKPGVGAACGMNKGYHGKGSVEYPASSGKPRLFLRDVGWKATASNNLVVIGQIWTQSAGKGKAHEAVDRFVALVNTTGGGACATKTNNTPVGYAPKGNNNGQGATTFQFLAGYQIMNGDQNVNDLDGMCKGSELTCAYGPKKEPNTPKFQP